MPETVGSGVPNGGDQEEPLKVRLARLWREGKLTAFYTTVESELAPKVRAFLRGNGLSHEEAEDCFEQALEPLVERQDGRRDSIDDPEAYLWACAKNAANDFLDRMVREREAKQAIGGALDKVSSRPRKKLEDEQEALGGGSLDSSSGISELIAVQVVETFYGEVTAEPGWSVKAFQLIRTRLTPALVTILDLLLYRGPEYLSTDAPGDLGMSKGAFRRNKKRLYDILKVQIPKAVDELGIKLVRPLVDEEPLYREPFPSEDPESQGDGARDSSDEGA